MSRTWLCEQWRKAIVRGENAPAFSALKLRAVKNGRGGRFLR